MKKITALLILCVMSLSTVLSQDTAKLNLKEVTHYLIEGVECKEILIQRNKQLRTKDSVINLTNKYLDSCKKLYNVLYLDNEECNKQYSKLKTYSINKKKENYILKGFVVFLMILVLK